MSDTMREISRKDFTSRHGNTIEAMNAGSLQRIADATEKMAQRHTDLITERDQAKRSAEYWRARADRLERSNRSFKGQITKLKKALALAKAQT